MKRALLAFLCVSTVLRGALAQATYEYPVDETDKTPPAELKSRRDTIKKELGAGTIGVFFTNPTRNRNNDVDFDFRADSNFLYLTGFNEPDAALILSPDGFQVDGKTVTEVLFLNEPDQMSLTWLGYRMGPYYAERLLGMEMALPNKRFAEIFKLASSGKKLTTGRMPAGPVDTLAVMIDAMNKSKEEQKLEAGPRISRKLSDMRGIKSAYEIEMLRKVCDISARAHVAAMKAIKPNMREYEIAALVKYQFAKEGCEYEGYPPICGSGPNSTILHYEANRRLMKDGEIYCMDSAGEYHGYSADVTRTFPVNGKFTPEQKEIYQIVYDAQEAGIAMCKPGSTFRDIEAKVRSVLSAGLLKLGIIKNANELGRYYMHGFGHGIGLDVHDPAPATLVAGAALTVEPGIYIKANSPCDPKYWNIGVRIEDDILVTENGPENMSKAAPRTIAEVEKTMASR